MNISEKTLIRKSESHASSALSTVRNKRKALQVESEGIQSGNIEANKRKSTLSRKEKLYNEASAGEIMKNVTKTPEDAKAILAALNSHFIFKSLTDEDKEIVLDTMQLYSFKSDTFVYLQKMPSKSYYVIRTGSVDIIINGRKVNSIHEGEGFGELALLQDSSRSTSVKCTEPTTLWALDRITFKTVAKEMNIKIYEQNRAFLEKVSVWIH